MEGSCSSSQHSHGSAVTAGGNLEELGLIFCPSEAKGFCWCLQATLIYASEGAGVTASCYSSRWERCQELYRGHDFIPLWVVLRWRKREQRGAGAFLGRREGEELLALQNFPLRL